MVVINNYTGRTPIVVNDRYINRENVADIVQKTMTTHQINSVKINYLYNYYKGEQPIQTKTKSTRIDINNIVTENRAYEIVSFKKGYTFGEPIQYISRRNKDLVEDLNVLNDYMVMCNKNDLDNDLAEWILISGVGYRLVVPNSTYDSEDEAPFEIMTLDPRNTYVIRTNDTKQSIIAGVTYITNQGLGNTTYVYTKDKFYVIEFDNTVKEYDQYLGYVPIIEYTSGNARLGAFEVVLPLLDAINNVQSLRIDDIQQHVDSILTILGGDMDEDTYRKVQEWKTLVLPEGVDAKYISSVLDQHGVQKLADALYQTILTICGMPNRNGGGGDNGVAVVYRDGWQNAETQAKNIETKFIVSEKLLLKAVLRIMRDTVGTNLKMLDIEVKFGRRYADNILTKVQALIQLLDAGINPIISLATVGIWNDPIDVATQSLETLQNRWGLDDVRENGPTDIGTTEEDSEEI